MARTAHCSKFKHLIAMALVVATGTGCSFLYVGSSVPAIETFDISPGKMTRTTGATYPTTLATRAR